MTQTTDAGRQPTISAVIVTRDAEAVIEACLQSVEWCDEIVVVDLASVDRTAEICRRYTGRVIAHERLDHTEPAKEFAFAQATGDWILSLDAKERVTPLLAALLRSVAIQNPEVNGFKLPVRMNVLGKWFEHGGIDPNLTEWRFFRPGAARQSSRLHKALTLFGVGASLTSENKDVAIESYVYPTVHELIADINRFTSIEAQQMADIGGTVSWANMLEASAAEFVTRYQTNSAHNDGMQGFLFSMAMAFYAFLNVAKTWEQREKAGLPSPPPPASVEEVLLFLSRGAKVAGWPKADDPAPETAKAEPEGWGRLGENSEIVEPSEVHNPGRVLAGDNVIIQPGARIAAHLASGERSLEALIAIGDNVTIGRSAWIAAANQVVIGQNVTIDSSVTILDFVPDENGYPVLGDDEELGAVVLEDGVQIGSRVTIGPKVRIGMLAAVADDSVVVGDVPPLTKVAGNPAMPVAQFDPHTSEWVPVDAADAEDYDDEPTSVSIIVPVAGEVERVLLSQRAMEFAVGELPYEIIFVAPAEDTVLAEKLGQVPGDTTLIQTDGEVSLVEAVNQAAQIARGKYLAVLPPEAAALPGWLDSLVHEAEADPDVAMVAARQLDLEGGLLSAGGNIQPDGSIEIRTPNALAADWPTLIHFAPLTGALLRRDTFLTAGGLNPAYGTANAAAAEFGLVLKACGYRNVFAPSSIVVVVAANEDDPALVEQDRLWFLQRWTEATASRLPAAV